MSDIKTTLHYDAAEDRMVVAKEQDVSKIIDANKRAYNQDGGYKSETLNHVARIPLVALMEWLKQKGITYREFMQDSEGKLIRMFCNDPDNKYFRTRPGKI